MELPESPLPGEPPEDLPEIAARGEVIAGAPVVPGEEAGERGSWGQLAREWMKRSWLMRLALLYAGVVGPAICLIGASGGDQVTMELDPWQSGDLHIYASFLLSTQTSFAFLPLLAFSMVGCTLSLWDFDRYARRLWVRWALYAGVLLALHFWVVHALVVMQANWADAVSRLLVSVLVGLLSVGGVVLALAVVLSLERVSRKWRATWGWWVWVLLSVAVVLVLALFGVVTEGEGFFGLVGGPVVATLFLGPAWCLAAYVLLSLAAAREYGSRQWKLWQFFVLMGWLGAYFAAFRVAAVRMFAAYAELPTEQPEGCYVASAAAGGHRRLVGGWQVRCAGGEAMRVTAQLAWLKAGELVLRAAAPGVHGGLRRVYDRVGPPVAARLRRSAWLADAAYVSLKPAEGATRLVLWLLLGDVREWVEGLYGERKKDVASPRAMRTWGD